MYTVRPTMKELVEALREFLEANVSLAEDTYAFQTRVAINVTKIVERELALGSALETQECKRLSGLLQQEGALKELNQLLCKKLRTGEIDYYNPELLDHLKKSTMGRLSIDNPRYAATDTGAISACSP